MNNEVQVKMANASTQAFGYHGGKVISVTTAVTPATGYEFTAIQAISDTIISAYSQPTGAIALSDLTGDTIETGNVIYGRFSSITLTSGSVIGYHGIAQTAIR